jgi:photosystem II stability/assembly factor-like uncharacterized protein
MKNLTFHFLFSLFSLHFSLFTINSLLAQQYGWIDLSDNIPDSNVTMKDIHAIGQEVWIAHGNNPNSVVYYSSDGGQSFIAQAVPANSGMGMGVFMRSSLEGYLVSNTGRILRTLDGGNNWTTISTVGGSLYSISFPPLPEPTGYTCGSSGRIFSITNSTVTLDHVVTGATFYSIVFPVNSTEGWVCGGTAVKHRTSAGWQWDQNYPPEFLNSIYFVDNLNGWTVQTPSVGSTKNVVWYTHDGHNWSGYYIPDNSNLNDICFINTSEGWAVGNNLIIHTIDGGTTWIKEPTSITDSTLLLSVFAVNNHEVYVVGRKYGVGFNRSLLLKYTIVTGIQEYTGKESGILFQNHPNPFNQSTVISWQVPVCSPHLAVSSHEILKVYDFMGKEIRTLVDKDMVPGEYKVTFYAAGLPAGVYFYQLQVNGHIETKKMILTE